MTGLVDDAEVLEKIFQVPLVHTASMQAHIQDWFELQDIKSQSKAPHIQDCHLDSAACLTAMPVWMTT